MELSLKESLEKLERLSPARLHETSRRIRKDLGGAEWKMGVCLLAAQRTLAFRKLGYATISRYAERALHISGKKAGGLLSAAKVLEHHPLLSEAYRKGTLGWGKLRAIKGLVTPETERQWLDFCVEHDTDSVANKVALSPAAWKRYQALQASLKEKPIVEPEELASLLQAEPEPSLSASQEGEVPSREGRTSPRDHNPGARGACNPPGEKLAGISTGEQGSSTVASSPIASAPWQNPPRENAPAPPSAPRPLAEPKPLPFAPQRIRVVIEMTPDQYALFERAESRVRARAQKRLPRAEVVTVMAEAVLQGGTARSRAKHQVLIHKDAQTGVAWYDTQRGPLPVCPELVERVQGEREPLLMVGGQLSEGSVRLESTGKSAAHPTEHPTLKISESPATERANDSQAPIVTQPSEAAPPKARPDSYEAAPLRPMNLIQSPTPKLNRSIPNDTLRRLFAQAGQQCQTCGNRAGPFEAHHTTPFSEGGTHQLPCLRLLCRACHSLEHQDDFKSKAHWAAAKAVRCRRSLE